MKKANLLEMTPFRLLEYESENGFINVLLPRFSSRFWGPKLQPLLAEHKKYIRIKLDEIGSETWLLMDGTKTVSEITEHLRQKFGDKVEPVYDRLGKFISMMYEQRYISFKELKN